LMPVVLYIDDSGVERRIVQRILEGDGFRVFTAEKPEEGLDAAARVRPDVILLDLHLEGTGGWQLAERLRKMRGMEEVPIVAISASLKDEERPEVLRRFDGFIQKPVDVDLLPRMVREFMGGKTPVERQETGDLEPASEGIPSQLNSETLEVLETLEKVRSIMSHDLRTPLTVMISYASTVSRGKVGEINDRQREMLDLVVQQGFQMDAQIAELVKMAKETLGRFGYPPGKR